MFSYLYKKLLRPMLKVIYNRLVKPIFELQDSPHSIALGVAIGMWIALTPTVGIQMTLSLIICTIFRANILIAVAMAWISNPITFIPMYYGYYRLGLVLMNEEATSLQEFKQMITNDYVIVNTRPQNETKNIEAKIILQKIAKAKLNLLYSNDESISAKVTSLAKENNLLPLDTWATNKEKLFSIDAKYSKSLNNGAINTDLQNIFSTYKYKINPKYTVKTKENDKAWEMQDKEHQYLCKKIRNKINIYKYFDTKTILKKLKNSNDYGFIARIKYLLSKKDFPNKKIRVISAIKRKQTFWDMCWNMLIMGFKAFALPMWLGSLIIATICAIPSYFLTYRTIVRFRKKIAKLRKKTSAYAKQRIKKIAEKKKKITETIHKIKTHKKKSKEDVEGQDLKDNEEGA